MINRRILGSLTVLAVAAAAVLYTAHPVRSSDHQDTYNLATRSNTSADITDVFVFPSPTNANNVVFVMDVSPLIPAGMGTSKFFDPTLMWQFKIAHGTGASPEDQVIQFGANGTGASQTLTLYGPAKPNEVGTANTFVTPGGTFNYNTATQLANGIKVFAGPRADPFYLDLFALFSFLGDRNYATHSSQTDPGPAASGPLFNGDNAGAAAAFAPAYDKSANPAQPTFNGFKAGTTAGAGSALGNYACSTNAPQNTLTDLGGGFNVLAFVVEVPRSLLTTGYSSSTIHVWATTNSSTGS
ncbi:hypothetical protein WPS_17790 [Vulcanimicrobium alpinum]|uniref:DUF4331 domain-containing protein n=1 Tax=Vulcanimicrobium alpinum TaxID=3016050 RepID=A0AAN1XY56_UNVUL|nr:hypothetical protein WPS_17790 [Vulcanimicrobium alpinum]